MIFLRRTPGSEASKFSGRGQFLSRGDDPD